MFGDKSIQLNGRELAYQQQIKKYHKKKITNYYILMLRAFLFCFCLLLSSWASIHRRASLESNTRNSRLKYKDQLKFVLFIFLFIIKRKLAVEIQKYNESLYYHCMNPFQKCPFFLFSHWKINFHNLIRIFRFLLVFKNQTLVLFYSLYFAIFLKSL